MEYKWKNKIEDRKKQLQKHLAGILVVTWQ